MTRFRFDMMPPPNDTRVGDAVTRRFEPALVEESVLDFEVLVSPIPKAHQAMWAFSGLAHGGPCTAPAVGRRRAAAPTPLTGNSSTTSRSRSVSQDIIVVLGIADDAAAGS